MAEIKRVNSMRTLLLSACVLAALLATAQTRPYPKPQVGSAEDKPAPDFTLKDQDGKEFKLSDQRGHWVLLFFYRGYW
jgi:cytochrome oxidase Cu insertion factor (SCO1/SenC/PrrC family)